MQKTDFLYPRSTYRGQSSTSAFNTKLQAFSQQLTYLCGLQANGKVSQEKAYGAIEILWQQLEHYQQTQDEESL
ncbi:MAG TPA: hypothetical protein V6D18_06925 [Thermosynechococcaceae cyanobacterium]